MATQKLNLTRDQLATFLRSHEQIRQFEQLFRATNSNATTIEVIGERLDALENPPGVIVSDDYQATTDAYWIVMSATGKTVTLPKGVASIIGRVWSITLAAAGSVTIETSPGDTVPTPADPAETTIILDRRGSTVAMRCTSETTWGFA